MLNTHYTGTFAVIGYHFPLRFFNRLGATEVDPDTICNKAGHTALELVYGRLLDGFDPRQAANAASIVVWGANPAHSAPHQAQHWLGEAPCLVIVVDPIRTRTAERADVHLAPRPGTDAALAFSLIHVHARDGLADGRFLDEHCVGAGQLLEMAGEWTPAVGEATTGVPAADIERTARLFGSGPSLLWIGQGLQRQPDRRSRGPVPVQGAVLLEHQPRRLQPGTGSAQGGARPGGPLHRGRRPVHDRHCRGGRCGSARREFPPARRSRTVVLPSEHFRSQSGPRCSRRGAAQLRDLPGLGHGHGLGRA